MRKTALSVFSALIILVTYANEASAQKFKKVGPGRKGLVEVYTNTGKQKLSDSDQVFRVSTYDGSKYNYPFAVKKNGRVAIGDVSTSTPFEYKLYVQSGILTEKLRVANKGDFNWADFVFETDYELMPLGEVEKFIKQHKHLPGVPSESEVKRDGIDVASMDAKLLQKIEELTLYVIEQQKEIDMLKKKLATQ